MQTPKCKHENLSINFRWKLTPSRVTPLPKMTPTTSVQVLPITLCIFQLLLQYNNCLAQGWYISLMVAPYHHL